MGVCAASIAIVLSRIPVGACASSPIRKQVFSVQVATDGNIEISDGPADSTRKQSQSFARRMGSGHVETRADMREKGNAQNKSGPIRKRVFQMQVATDGDIKISNGLIDSTPKRSARMGVDAKVVMQTGGVSRDRAFAPDKSSPIRKHASPMQVAIDGDIELSDGIEAPLQGDSTALHTRAIVRKMKSADTTRSNFMSLLVTKLTKSSEKHGVLRNTATVVQNIVARFRNRDQSWRVNFVSFCFLSMMAGFLAAAVVARIGSRRQMSSSTRTLLPDRNRNRNGESSNRCAPISSEGSDAKLESSSEEHVEHRVNIRTSLLENVVRTGLLWKLERRFIPDLMSHSGPYFEPTDRFAYLEKWDLRFFSLDVDEGAVLLTYVSELNKFSSVVFEIKSIKEIIQIPRLHATRNKFTKTPSNAPGHYDDYLERLRQLGYDPPRSVDTRDPESLSVLVMSGKRQDEDGSGSRGVGRLRWHADDAKDEALSYMCLGCAHGKDCHRWHDEISHLLKSNTPKPVNRSRKSYLSQRVAHAASLEQSLPN